MSALSVRNGRRPLLRDVRGDPGKVIATRLNLGCGTFPLDGYTNIDAHVPSADVIGDFMDMDFSDVDEVVMSHVLEHFSWRETRKVLHRVFSWMRPGGIITVEVPNMDVLLGMGTDVQQWQLGIFGSQQHDGEFHKAGFTRDTLAYEFEQVGFTVLRTSTFRSENPERFHYPCIEVVGAVPD